MRRLDEDSTLGSSPVGAHPLGVLGDEDEFTL